jgi:hypothetical protein
VRTEELGVRIWYGKEFVGAELQTNSVVFYLQANCTDQAAAAKLMPTFSVRRVLRNQHSRSLRPLISIF